MNQAKFQTHNLQEHVLQRLDSPFIQLYLIDHFLSQSECEKYIQVIDQEVSPSNVVGDSAKGHRTSQTAYLTKTDPLLSKSIDARISGVLGVSAERSEPIQGQRYYQGEFYKEHFDWFDVSKESGQKEVAVGGQRTWTFMVYLNTVLEGGGTHFPKLGLVFQPLVGRALCWRNLNKDGSANDYALHEAQPVALGSKYVITKWFRQEPGRNVV